MHLLPGRDFCLPAVGHFTLSGIARAGERYGRGKTIAFPLQDSFLWRMDPKTPVTDTTYSTFWRRMARWLVDDVPEKVMLTMTQELGQKFFNIDPLIVGPGIKTGMPILYENPKDVGADRIVNGIAAYEKYRNACIIVDFGTATTIDLISKKGDYIGGAIAPGLSISLEALIQRASKLPRVEIVKPKEVIGRNTIHSIQAGIFYG